MDCYQSYLLHRVCIRNIGKLAFNIILSEFILGDLVEKGIISSEERYSIFAYPICTVFRNTCRLERLLEILRNRCTWLPFLRYFKSYSYTSSDIREFMIEVKVLFYTNPAFSYLELSF
jgi:hypothetical protein